MRTLYLHIGHFKTGSSYLQELWRANTTSLESSGIAYPIPDRLKLSGYGRVTSGNGGQAFISRWRLQRTLSRSPTASSLLLSSENINFWFQRHSDLSFVSQVASRHGFDKIEILFFLRNPIDLASSMYGQTIKSNRQSNDIDQFLLNSSNTTTPTLARDVIEKLQALPNCHLTLRNYSAVKNQLLQISCEWLGIGEDTLTIPPMGVVNRSLTKVERDLLLMLNRAGALDTEQLADDLVVEASTEKPSSDLPSTAQQQAYFKQQALNIEWLNNLLPKDEQLSVVPVQQRDDQSGTFSLKQLEILARYIRRHQKRRPWFMRKFIGFRKRFGI